MKLSDLKAKLTGGNTLASIKGNAVRVLAAGMLAGAVLTAAAPAAKAQHFAVGVQFGAPAYVPPPPPRVYGYGAYPGYWEHRRWEQERERERRAEFFRHQEWERFHHPYGYGIRPY